MKKKKRGDVKTGRQRSKLLYQITALVVILLIAIGLIVFFIVNGALNRLIEKDKADRAETEAQIIYADSQYIVDFEISELMLQFPNYNIDDVTAAISQKKISEFQRVVNDKLHSAVERGLIGSEYYLIIQPEPKSTLPYPYVLASSDDNLMYMEVPEYILKAVEEGKTYIWMENGIPELGLEGEYLIIINKMKTPFGTSTLAAIGIRPMHEEISHMDSFYEEERTKVTLILALVIGIGIVLVILITFFILRMLIRRQITQPIDELAGVAGEVMEGNLDVEIEVRKGEEFEVLKRAFKEMVESLRSIMERASR
jgi:methyl-accepting chemotaxis protein